MKVFAKVALAAAMVVGLGAGAASADKIKFGVANEPYPPFSSADASGKWVGWEMDLMDMVCAEAKLECELVPTAWDGIIPALNSKQIDVIWSSMSITAERKQSIDFTNMYYNSGAVLISGKTGDMDITPAHLTGKTIGVQVSTIHEKYIQKHYASAGATVKTYQTQDEANNDLAAGRIDYAMADSLALDAFLQSDAGKACCELKGLVADDKEVLGEGVGGGVRKDDTALKDQLNAAISALAKAGKFQELNAKHGLEGKVVVPES